MSVQVKGSGTIGGLDEGLVVSGIVTSSTQINVGSNIKIGNAGVGTFSSINSSTSPNFIIKDGTTEKGYIGFNSNDPFIGRKNGVGVAFQNNKIRPVDGDDGSGSNNTVDIGENSYKFKDAYFSGTVTANSFAGDGSNLTGLTVPGGATNLDLLDSSGTGNGRIRLGASQDLQIYHDGSHSWFKNTTGRLLLQTDGDQIQLRGNTIVAFNGAASTEYLRITSGGHISQGGGAEPSSSNGSVAKKFGIKSNANNVIIGETESSGNGSGLHIESRQTGRSGDARIAQIGMKNDASGNGQISFFTAPNGAGVAERMVINSGGSVNIGGDYTQTSYKLGVSGSAKFRHTEADIWLESTGGSSTYWRILGSTGGSTHRFRIYDQTNTADRLNIDGSGRVTQPAQPTFYATANSGGTVSMTSTHTFTNWRLSTSGRTYDVGSNFNTSNGRFTAPITGKYLFTGSILLAGYDQASSIHVMWRKNGSTFQYWYNTRTSDIDRSGYGGYLAQGSTTTMTLDANDYVDVACNFSGSLSLWCGDANWGHFSGHLLG